MSAFMQSFGMSNDNSYVSGIILAKTTFSSKRHRITNHLPNALASRVFYTHLAPRRNDQNYEIAFQTIFAISGDVNDMLRNI